MDERDAEIAALKTELAALRERDRDLTDFVENASLALHWVGADGRILWANQAELDLLGYRREEYFGRHISEFHVDLPAAEDMLARLGRRETLHNYEARLRARDGTVHHVAINSSVRWNRDQFLHTRCFTRDITEHKRSEQRLRAQTEVAQILASAASLEEAAPRVLEAIGKHLEWGVGMLWTPREKERVLRCAAHWEALPAVATGFAEQCRQVAFPKGTGLPGRVWITQAPAWITDLSADGNFPRLRLAAEHGLRSAFAFPILHGEQIHGVMEFFDETTRVADDELLQVAVSLGYQMGEFVERTRARRQLAEREESYRVLTETVSDGIVTVDAAGAIVFANRAAAKIFGYTAAELAGSDLALLLPDHRRILAPGLPAQAGAAVRPPAPEAHRMAGVHRNGYEIPIEVSFGEYQQGGRHFFAGIIRDLTERNRLDETLRESAKLESLGVLAGGIAHDFNNLLTGILGNVSLALDALEETETARLSLEDAIEASERAANLTKQLLAYAGKGRFVIEATELSALVREISALIRSSIPKHVTLRLDLEQPLPLVDADVAQLHQLIMNLVINGAEAIPENRQGTLLVMTRALQADAPYLAVLGAPEMPPGSYVVISVHDNGMGMDEETIGKIFDPFFTTKFTGRGLGLAAAGGIVRGHKGAIRVFSSPGQGTTFKVLLPVSAVVRARAAAHAEPSDLSGRGLVLVVDDESIVRKIASSSLERYGYSVVTAGNGREGVERFQELNAQLRLVILDMTMPVMNGEEALEAMRRIDSRVPVVLSSGYSEVEAISRFSGKGLAGFLQKPYTAAALAEKVRSVLREERNLAV